MKRVLKFILLIIVFFAITRIEAKELVKEELQLYKNQSHSNNRNMILDSDGAMVSYGSYNIYCGYHLEYEDDCSGYVLTKFNNDGSINKRIRSNLDSMYLTLATNDGYYFINDIYKIENNNTSIIKTDKELNVQWKYEIENDNYTVFKDIKELSDQSIIIIGNEISPQLTNDQDETVNIIKIDKNGNYIASKSYNNDEGIYFEKGIVSSTNDNIMVLYRHNQGNGLIIYNKNLEVIKDIRSEQNHSFENIAYYNNSFIVTGLYYLENQNNEIKGTMYVYDDGGNLLKQNEYLEGREVEFLNISYIDNKYIFLYKTGQKINNIFEVDYYIASYDKNLNIIKKTELRNFDWRRTIVFENNNKIIVYMADYIHYLEMEIFNNNLELISSRDIGGQEMNAYHNSAAHFSDDSIIYIGVNRGLDDEYRGGMIKKFDKNGNLIFNKVYSNTAFYSILKVENDNYIISGIDNNGKYTLFKYDKSGEIIWKYEYENEDKEYSYAKQAIQKNDNSIISVSEFKENGDYILNLRKIDKNKSLVWSVNHASYDYYSIESITLLDDGKIIITGTGGYRDSFILVFNNQGELISEKNFEIESPSIFGTSICIPINNNEYMYILPKRVEETNSGTQSIINIYKYNSNNQLDWSKELAIDGTVNIRNYTRLSNGTYMLAGDKAPDDFSNGYALLLNIDNLGNKIDEYYYAESNLFYDVYQMNDGTIRGIGANYPGETAGFPMVYDIYYKYDITPKQSNNGTFTVDKIKAKNKEIITINAKPKLGYIVDKVIVTDSKGNKTEFRDLTFEMIPDDVEVEVVFRELINPKTGFSLITIIAMITGLIIITIRKKREV